MLTKFLYKENNKKKIGFIILFGLVIIIYLYSYLHTSSSEQNHCPNNHKNENFMEECLIDVLSNLPYNPKEDKYSAHHSTARTGKWNEEIRFNPLKIDNSKKCVILDVGGNTNSDDTWIFLSKYPECEYYVYEPIPSYVKNLEKVFKNNENVHVKGVGWGYKDEEVYISSKSLQGGATFIMDSKGGKGNILIKMKTPSSILEEIPFDDIDLLHLNCEGGEWEALLFMGENDLFKKFKTIQMSFHNYGNVGVGIRSLQLCEIRKYLGNTHTMVEGIPYGWERYERK